MAVAKALESGQCGLTELYLAGEAESARAFSLFWFCRGAVCDGGCGWWCCGGGVVAWMAGVSDASLLLLRLRWLLLFLLWAVAAFCCCGCCGCCCLGV